MLLTGSLPWNMCQGYQRVIFQPSVLRTTWGRDQQMERPPFLSYVLLPGLGGQEAVLWRNWLGRCRGNLSAFVWCRGTSMLTFVLPLLSQLPGSEQGPCTQQAGLGIPSPAPLLPFWFHSSSPCSVGVDSSPLPAPPAFPTECAPVSAAQTLFSP